MIDSFINKVFQMDNLELMKKLPDNSIDLIYSDILYGTGKDFKDYKDLKTDKKVIEDFYIPRIKEMHRVLSNEGNLILQMDYHISHWIRNICDEIFNYNNFINEIIWHYQAGTKPKNKLGCKHDNLLHYSKSKKYTYNDFRMPSTNIKNYNKVDKQGYRYLVNGQGKNTI